MKNLFVPADEGKATSSFPSPIERPIKRCKQQPPLDYSTTFPRRLTRSTRNAPSLIAADQVKISGDDEASYALPPESYHDIYGIAF